MNQHLTSSLNELRENLKKKGISPATKELNFFLDKKRTISQYEYNFSLTDISRHLKDFWRDNYGSDAKESVVVDAAKKIMSRFGQLTLDEVFHCLDLIITGEEVEPKKYNFNVAFIMEVLTRYEKRKKSLTNAFFEIQKEQKRDAETQAAADQFLQEALRKLEESKALTIYEQSAIGKHYVSDMPDDTVRQIKEMTDEELPNKLKEIGAIRKSLQESTSNKEGRISVAVPDMYVHPVAWNHSLLFGVIAFAQIQ